MIALMTDFGADSIFIGIMKGVMATINPCVTIIDLCHDIPPFAGAVPTGGRTAGVSSLSGSLIMKPPSS